MKPKATSAEYQRFTEALRHVVHVSHSELKAREDAWKLEKDAKRAERQKLMERRKIGRKVRVSGHASGDKD